MKEFKNIKAVLFDLDGTLMDTDNQSVERITKWLDRLHFPHSPQLARRFVMASETPVNGLITLIDRLGIDKPLMNFWQRLNRKSKKVKHEFHIIPGVAEMLDRLKGRFLLAVVTTRSQAEAQAFLRENNLLGIFEVIVTRTSTFRLKPHPDPILFAAKQLDVPVEQCLMVGDTTPDIYAANAAGACSIGVLCGFGRRGELEKAGAAAVLEHTAEVASVLISGIQNEDR